MTKHNANVYSTLGASNHAATARAELDLYCTHPKAVEELLRLETFRERIWEPCDGLGHIPDVLAAHGHEVRRSDILTRGRDIEQLDFLACDKEWHGDIVTNPPYSDALPIIRKALDVVAEGCKVAMWLRILFLEGKARKEFFRRNPPRRVWVSSARIPCSLNGGTFGASAVCYAWFMWEKGYRGETIINWF